MTGGGSTNRSWAELMVEELVRCGVDLFCLAPGLRSAPLALAAVAHTRARTLVHYDERGAAFYALGYARATRRPAVWITTSGTALGNGLPAVIEASVDQIPMLLLTADRPPELRDTGANQTIDQVGIFGRYVRWFTDLPAPTGAIEPSFVLTTMDQAYFRSVSTPEGPVHVNCMFREPLVGAGASAPGPSESLTRWKQDSGPYTRYAMPRPELPDPGEIASLLEQARRGLIVAGRLRTKEDALAVLRLSKHLGWPVLADLLSHLRLGREDAHTIVGGYERLLGRKGFEDAHAPEIVLQLGRACVSKALRKYLHRCRPNAYVLADAGPQRTDPDHMVTHRLQADVALLCESLRKRVPAFSSAGWLESWREHCLDEERWTDAVLEDAAQQVNEPYVARAVSRLVPESHALFVSSSMPVRDMDLFASASGPPVRIAANRGASGIDGTIATAAGFAAGLSQRVTVIAGDLALLHDLNSLGLAAEASLVVVVLNNDGGGIFHFIPGALSEAGFETVLGTPHGLAFRDAARMFGLDYVCPGSREDFATAYSDACASAGSTLIEVRTNRKENHDLHASLRRGPQEDSWKVQTRTTH